VFALFRRMQTELGFENESFITDPNSPEYAKFMKSQQGPPPDPYVEGKKIDAQVKTQQIQSDQQGKVIELQGKREELAARREQWITELEVGLPWTSPSPESGPRSQEERMRRAQAAHELIQNPLLRESINSVEATLLKQMHQVKLDDVAGHTRLILALQVSQAVNRHLWAVMQDGEGPIRSCGCAGGGSTDGSRIRSAASTAPPRRLHDSRSIEGSFESFRPAPASTMKATLGSRRDSAKPVARDDSKASSGGVAPATKKPVAETPAPNEHVEGDDAPDAVTDPDNPATPDGTDVDDAPFDPAKLSSLTELADAAGLESERLMDLELPTKIDGKEGKARLRDLVKSYQLDGHINQKLATLDTDRKTFESKKVEHERTATTDS
jgi:hypothetical protein